MSNSIQNISLIHDCYGCGICALSCKKKIIDIRQNSKGFLVPYVTAQDQCTNCGICQSVCSFTKSQLSQESNPISSYAAWSNNQEIRKKSSSGGVSYELGKAALANGWKFCGVRYNAIDNIVEHFIAESECELKQTSGSKYLQSYTLNAFREIENKDKYVIVGTPCQIDSFRRYIQTKKCEENFVLIDFFCHGVPSKLLWDKYLNEKSNKNKDIKNATWRNKQRGWKKSYCVTLEYENETKQSFKEDGDEFFTLFLGNACLNPACYDNCKYKFNNSSADIRIGDFWGYSGNEESVNSVITFSPKGEALLHTADLYLKQMTFNEVTKAQLKKNPQKPWYYAKTTHTLENNNKSISDIAKKIRIYKTFTRQIKKILKI